MDKGADLLGNGTAAFTPAAAVHQGALYASLGDGGLYRLDEAGGKWVKSGAASPRVAHRIASDDKEILVVGGASKDANSNLIESWRRFTDHNDGIGSGDHLQVQADFQKSGKPRY